MAIDVFLQNRCYVQLGGRRFEAHLQRLCQAASVSAGRFEYRGQWRIDAGHRVSPEIGHSATRFYDSAVRSVCGSWLVSRRQQLRWAPRADRGLVRPDTARWNLEKKRNSTLSPGINHVTWETNHKREHPGVRRCLHVGRISLKFRSIEFLPLNLNWTVMMNQIHGSL